MSKPNHSTNLNFRIAISSWQLLPVKDGKVPAEGTTVIFYAVITAGRMTKRAP